MMIDDYTGWRAFLIKLVVYPMAFVVLLILLPWLWAIMKQQDIEDKFKRDNPSIDV